MARGKPTGTIKRSAPTPFRPKSLGYAPKAARKPSLPTQKRSVGTQIPSAPKPRSAVKPIKPGIKVAPRATPRYTEPNMARRSKASGVITAAKTAANVASYIPGLGGLAARAVSAVLPDGTPVYTRRKRRRGLTYSDIRGATRVLKLVKKFAPPGSRAKLRVRHHTY